MTFLDQLRQSVITGDGAIGTMLYSKGVGLDANFEHLNLVKPDLVLELHREYIAAGAQVIETNTFGANFTKLQPIGLAHKIREINYQGARLARRAAAGASVVVAGSIGPLARLKGEERDLAADEMREMFRVQASALAEGGVDILLLETFSDLRQALEALAAAKETGLPVVVSMAYMEQGRTAAGDGVEEVTVALAEAGADVIGANCGAGPLELLQTVRRMAAVTDLPLAAYPNSGFPEYLEGRYIYRTTPEYFADMGVEIAEAGASVIGGCCGTTPAHIERLTARIAGLKPVARSVWAAVVSAAPVEEVETGAKGFLADWGRRKVVTVELDPPRGLDCEKVLTGCRILKEAGADAINLAENPLARVRVGNIALASLIEREIGIEVIVHITCRDRNLLGLQSELMGASLLGVRSILAVTGDPVRLGDQAGASSVFDLNSFGLIKLLAGLNAGVNGIGSPIGRGTNFTIGAAFNPNTAKMENQVARLVKKVENGAQFAQTQPLYDPARLAEMVERTKEIGIPILPGILPVVSERNCEFLHNEVPGIVIPDAIRNRMKGKEKEEGAREGLAVTREFIDQVNHLVGGFYIIPPFGRFELAAELVRYIRSLE